MGQLYEASYHLRYRGRLVQVKVCINYHPAFMRAVVIRGKPLDLRQGSQDRKKIKELVNSSERTERVIRAACDEMDRMGPW